MIIINSLLQIGQLNSNLYNFFEKKVIRCSLPFSSHCTNCPLNTKLNISVSTSKGLFEFIIYIIDLLTILYLIWSKMSYCFYIYSKVLSFFINSIKRYINRSNPSIKYRQKLINPRNLQISLTFVNYNQYFIISIFLSFISMILDRILNLK